MADFRDLVQDSTSVAGTAASAPLTNIQQDGRRTFGSTYSVGTSGIPYKISTQGTGVQWEIGLGTLSSATAFNRDQVLSSSNADALVSFSSGAKDIWVDAPASLLGRVDAYTTTPKLLGLRTVIATAITSATSLTVNATGATPGDSTLMFFNSDGVSGHVPTFTNAVASTSDAGYLNTAANIENGCQILKTPSQILYAFFQNAAGTPSATMPPGVPTIGTATAGNASASVAFTPSGSGGTPTSFVATSTPGGITGAAASSPISVPGLTNGTAYTFTVHAANGAGNSAESAASNSVTPAVPAGATAVTMSGPSSGNVGVASTAFTLGANGTITGSLVVTPSDSSGGGTFTPTTVTLTSGSPTGTFTYTAASTGAKTISVTNSQSLTNPTNITYTAAAGAAPVNLTTLSGITQSGSPNFVYTGNSSGGDVTNQLGISTVKSTAGAASTLQATVTDITGAGVGFALDPGSANQSYTFATWFGLQQGANFLVYSGGTLQTTVTSAFANGNLWRATPGTGGMLWEKSTDSGATWSTLYSQAVGNPKSVALFAHAYITGTAVLTGLKSTGLA